MDRFPRPAPPKRRSFWKVAGILLGLAVLTGFVSFAGLEKLRRVRITRRLQELQAEAQSRPTIRPVLIGEAVPGNAWEEYRRAAKEMDDSDEERAALKKFASRTADADRAAVERVLAARSKALDHLRGGARMAEGQYPVDWEKGIQAAAPTEMGGLETLVWLALCKARMLREQGRSEAAAELMLDAAQMGRDLAYNVPTLCELMGLGLLGRAFDELRELILSRELSPAQLAQLSRALEVMDGSFPPRAYAIKNDVLTSGITLRNEGVQRGGVADWLGANVVLDRGFEQSDDLLSRIAEFESKSGSEQQQSPLRTSIHEELENSHRSNRILQNALLYSWVSPYSNPPRERRAQLRLLRAAAHFKAFGQILELDDPLGDKLRQSRSGRGLKIWSVGRDRKDNGGVGGWTCEDEGDLVVILE